MGASTVATLNAGVRNQSLKYYQADEIRYVYGTGGVIIQLYGCRVVNMAGSRRGGDAPMN